MKIEINDGELNVVNNGVRIENITLNIVYYGKLENYVELTSSKWVLKDANIVESINKYGKFEITFYQTQKGLCLDSSFTCFIDKIEGALNLCVNAKLNRRISVVTYNNGFWTNGNRYNFFMGMPSYTTGMVRNQEIEGNQYLAYKSNENDYGAIGVVSFDNYFSSVKLNENGCFTFYSHLNEHLYDFYTITINKGQKISSDKLYIVQGNDDVLNEYGKQIANENKYDKKFDIPTGWCSWYYYLDQISQEKILENARVAKERDLHFDIIQIDEGWEKRHGDWEPNEKFSMGMGNLAKEINALGFKAGIWVAPFLFDCESEVFVNHQDWFIQNCDYVSHKKKYIDYSNEEALKWLYDLFHKLSYEWGYRYIKVDLVVDFLALGGFKNPSFNGLRNYRTACKIMRSAVTQDTFLLNCTSPIGPSAGFFDATRISKDIFENWERLREVANQVLKRTYINEYNIIDPDCIMVRTSESEDEECRRHCIRNDKEINSFITLMSVCGGTMMCSDKLSLLNEKDINKIKSLYPINNTPAKVIDMFDNDIPSIFKYKENGIYEIYAIINWFDIPEEFKIKLSEAKYAKEYFTKEIFDKAEEFVFKLDPHQSMILYFTKDKRNFNKLTNSILQN